MIKNCYNQILYPALKTKRERTKYINWQQFSKGTRGKPNEQLFPRQVVIQLKYVTQITGEPKYRYGQQEHKHSLNHEKGRQYLWKNLWLKSAYTKQTKAPENPLLYNSS